MQYELSSTASKGVIMYRVPDKTAAYKLANFYPSIFEPDDETLERESLYVAFEHNRVRKCYPAWSSSPYDSVVSTNPYDTFFPESFRIV